MDREKLLKRLTLLIFFILTINFFANKFYWYFSIWYFDMIMHTLGGFWVGLAFFYFFPPKEQSFNSVFKILSFVFLVGIGWEAYEILVDKVITQNPFNLPDTSSDIFFDLSGGLLAVFYFFKRIKKIMPAQENKV